MKSLRLSILLFIIIGIIHAKPADDNPVLPEAADDNQDNANPGMDASPNDKTDAPKDATTDEVKPEGDMPANDNTADDKPPKDKPTDDKPADGAAADDKAPEDKSEEDKPADDKPADDKQSDDKPADDKPADGKPADDKPADDKPADDKPADDKPADEKTTDDKPADDKPDDGKTVDGKSADDKPADEHSADDKPAEDRPADDKSTDGKPVEDKPVNEGEKSDDSPTVKPDISPTPVSPTSHQSTAKTTAISSHAPTEISDRDRMITTPVPKSSIAPSMAVTAPTETTVTEAVEKKGDTSDENAVERSKIWGAGDDTTADIRSKLFDPDVGQTVEKSTNNTMKMNGTTFRVAVRLLDDRFVSELQSLRSPQFQSLKKKVMVAVTSVYNGYHDFKQVAVIGFLETPTNDSDADKRNSIAGNSVIADFYLRFFIYGRHLRKLTDAVKSEKMGAITVSPMFVKAYTAEPKGRVCTPDCRVKCYSYCDEGCCNINVVPPRIVTWSHDQNNMPTPSSLTRLLQPALKDLNDAPDMQKIAKQQMPCWGSLCARKAYRPRPMPNPKLGNSKLQQSIACMGAGCGSPSSSRAAVCRGPSCPIQTTQFEESNCIGSLCGTPKPIFPGASPPCQGTGCERTVNQMSQPNNLGSKIAALFHSHKSKPDEPCLRPSCKSLSTVRSPCQGPSCPCNGPMCERCHNCQDCKTCPICPNCRSRGSIFPGSLQGQELGPSEQKMNIGQNIPSSSIQRLTPMEQSLLQQTLAGPDDKRTVVQQNMPFPNYNMNAMGGQQLCPNICRQRCLLSCPVTCCTINTPRRSSMYFAPASMCGLRGC